MPFGDSGGSKTQTTVQSSAPWAPTQPGLKQGIKDWTALYNSGGLSTPYYPGQTVAGVSPERSSAWQMVSDLSGNPNSSSVQSATDYNNAILKGDYSALQPMFDAARDTVNSNYEAAGRYGSGYHDNAVSKGVGSVIANAASTAASQAPGLQSAMYQPAQYLDTVGQERQQQAQNEIDANVQRYQYDSTAQQRAIQDFISGLSGNWGGSTTMTAPSTSTTNNPWLQLGGLGISALGSYFGSQ